MNLKCLAAIAALVLLSGPSFADSCIPFIQQPKVTPEGRSTALIMTSVNKNGVASWASLNMKHADAENITKCPSQIKCPIYLPERYETDTDFPHEQVFSDRRVSGSEDQFFASDNADQISITMTIEASPQVTLVLNSWNNVRENFAVTCSSDGVMHASTPDADFLFYFGAYY